MGHLVANGCHIPRTRPSSDGWVGGWNPMPSALPGGNYEAGPRRFVSHHSARAVMNQAEQWFSIRQPERVRIADFADEAALAERLASSIDE
jgi:hypothetical protein